MHTWWGFWASREDGLAACNEDARKEDQVSQLLNKKKGLPRSILVPIYVPVNYPYIIFL